MPAFDAPDSISRKRIKRFVLLISDENKIWSDLAAIEKLVGRSIYLTTGGKRKVKKGGAVTVKKARRAGDDQGSLAVATFDDGFLVRVQEFSGKHELMDVTEETMRQWRKGVINLGAGSKAMQAVRHLSQSLERFRRLVADGKLPNKKSGSGDAEGRVNDSPQSDGLAEEVSVRASAIQKTLASFFSHLVDVEQKTSLHETGLLLGLSVEKTQKALDMALCSDGSVMLKLFRSDKVDAERAFTKVAGYYYVWIRRDLGLEQPRWLRGTLHVRYPLPMGDKFAIRAKLNIPRLSPESNSAIPITPLEYDGYVDNKAHRVAWSFELRGMSEHNYFHLITSIRFSQSVEIGEPKPYEFHGFVGRYLTVRQDPAETISTGVVLLEMLSPEQIATAADHLPAVDPTKATVIKVEPSVAIMWTHHEVFADVNGSEFKRRDKLAEEFKHGR